MTLNEVRYLFPHLQSDQVYFNHAALGPWSTLALNRINEFAGQRSGKMIENYPNYVKWNLSAKEKIGKLIGAKPDRIAWVENVSTGINILAQGLNWKSGDRIILNDLEFPSNVYPFLNLKKQGVEVGFIQTENGRIEVGQIEKAITPKTKLVSISHVQFLSGFKADLDLIGDMCKKRKIIFCVDSIQSTGAVQIDVNKSKIDFLCGGTHKWLMSSQGVAYLYLNEELQSRIDQKFVGWTSVKDSWNLLDYNLTLRNTADKFQNGTMNALGISILEAVIDVFLEFGMQNIEKRILENTDYFIQRLINIGIEPILKDIPESHRAGIVSFKNKKAKLIFDELETRRIFAAVREGVFRFSPHFYNTTEEIDRVVEELKIILSL